MSRNLNKLLNYSLLKISLIPIMLWIISSLVFILLRVAPGDPVDAILGSAADEVSREFLRNKLGLNEPLIRRQVWIKNNNKKLAWAESWWNAEQVNENLKAKEEPIWKNLTQDRSELLEKLIEFHLLIQIG